MATGTAIQDASDVFSSSGSYGLLFLDGLVINVNGVANDFAAANPESLLECFKLRGRLFVEGNGCRDVHGLLCVGTG